MSREDRRKKLKEEGIIELNNNSYNNIITKSKEKQNNVAQHNSKLPTSLKTQVDNIYNKNNVQESNIWERIKTRANSILNDTGKSFSNFGLGVSSSAKSSLYYIEDASNNTFDRYKKQNQFNARLKKEQEERKNILNNNQNKSNVILPTRKNFENQNIINIKNPILQKAKENAELKSPVLQGLEESISKDEEKIQKNIENSETKIGKKVAELMPSIGQSVSGMIAGTVNPALGLSYFQTSAGGNYTREAKAKGLNDNQAILYGTIMGAMESITESIGAKLTTNVGKKFFKEGTKEGFKAFGLDVAENFFEESIMEPIQEIVTKATGGQEDWSNIAQRMWESGIDGALTSVIMGGASAGIGKATKLVTKMEQGQQIKQEELVDTLKAINDSEEVDIEKLLVNSFQFTAEDLIKNVDVQKNTEQKLKNIAGEINNLDAQNIIGKKENNKIENIIQKSNLDENIKENLRLISNKYNLKESDVQNLIDNTKNGKYAEKQSMTIDSNKLLNNVNTTTQKEDTNAQNQISEQPQNIKQKQLLQEEKNKIISEKIDKNTYINRENAKTFLESAVNNNFDINSKEIETISKILDNRNLKGSFNSKLFNGDINKGALYVNGEVTLNPETDIKKGLYDLVIHETSHSMLENNSELKNTILETLKTDSRYEQMYNDVAKRYSEEYKNSKNFQANVEEEMIADYLGENLSTEEFITKLSEAEQTKNQSKIKQVIDDFIQKIKDFFSSRFGVGIKETDAEKYYWNKIENLFYDTYLNTEIVKDENNRYSIGGKIAKENLIKSDGNNTNLEKMYNEALKLVNKKVDNETIRKQTHWFQDKNGDWKFEFSDKDMKLKKFLKENSNYKLGDILDHSVLFELYPKLKNYTVETRNMQKNKGLHIANKQTIRLNNKLLNSNQNIEKTIIHEIQHAIQNIENFEKGRSTQKSKLAYYNSLGEIEATDVSNRLIKEKYEHKELTNIPPESSKENPKHNKLEEYLENRGLIDKLKDKAYNATKDFFNKESENYNESFEESLEQNNRNDRELVVGRRGHLEGNSSNKELEKNSSSFSLQKDNKGRTLTKKQQEYFKDSKARDEKGNLIKVYHTTTDGGVQFNEFNPIGTEGYRFGNNIVNYFTESKDMSGSYANNKYQMANTSKLNNMEEARKWIKEQNTVLDEFDIAKQGNSYYIKSNNRPYGSFSFIDEKDLLKNLKEKFNKYRAENLGYTKDISKIQYQGYVDIKNPYIIDAEGKNWDNVNIKFDKTKQDLVNKIVTTQEEKNKLYELAKESEKKHNEYIKSEDSKDYNNFKNLEVYFNSSKLRELINESAMFGFSYSEYAKSEEAYGTDKLPFGNIKVKDINSWFDNIPSDWNEYLQKYGEITLEEYVKKYAKAYKNNMNYGTPSSYFEYNMFKTLNKDYFNYYEDLNKVNITPNNFYSLAKRNFEESAYKGIFGEAQTTNDIVKQVIEMNKNGSNYDGVMIKNVLDYGGYSETREPANLYVTFDSNQFKADDNLNPTTDKDIRYSQNTEGEWNKYLKETSRNKENRKTIKELRDAEVINISNNDSNNINSTVKAQNYEKRKNTNFKKEMSEFLGVSRFNKNNKGIFDSAISQIREEYNINGKVSEDTRNRIFDDMYNNLIKEDNNYYNTYKDLKIELENTELNITIETKKDITDFRDFKREYFNNLNISENNQGIDVDSYYQELNSQYPELFPETIINQSDQLRRIAEVSKSIRKSESNISAYANKYLSKEYKMWAKNEFEGQIDKLVKEYEIVDTYNQDRAKQNIKEEYVRPSTDEIRWIYDNRAKMQKEYEKVNNTTLLTKREKAIVDRLLKDEMDFEEILPGFNKEAIAKVYTAKQQLEYTNNAIKAYKKDVKNNMKELAENLVEGSVKWKDKKHGIQYARETAQRNIQDIMSKEEAEKINSEIFDKVIHNTSEQTRFINNYVEKINKLNIDKSNKYDWKSYNGKNIKINEADLAQLFIEKKIDENTLKEFGADSEKVKSIASTFREILEDTVNQMDNVYINFGYAPIEKRKNYFPHFLENKPDTLMTKIANALQFDINPDNLPTDIAGRTETFKPGRAFNRNILQRTTEKTDYNALKALDMYIQGASDIIYHTEDIQKIRALNEAIRDKYRDQKTQEKIEQIKENTELTEEERQKQIQAISDAQKTPLNNLVNWLDDYANSLANKKASGDRQMEKDIDRQMYTTMKNIEGKIASNLVGGNMSVALTNFAPLAQATGTTKLSNVLIGMIQTVQNTINTVHGRNDNFVYESDFLTSRRGSELTQKENVTSKISNTLSIPMEIIDNFTSESIVRAKYRENVKNGMEHSEALKKADTYARNLMADRSKGAIPILFDRKNPVMKVLTAFQVEPNNTFSNYTKDIVRDSKSKSQIAYQVAKLSVASYAFNTLLKSIRGGGDVIPNPIGIVSKLISLATSNLDDDDENDEDPKEVLLSISSDILGSVPFGSAIATAGVSFGMDELSDNGRLMTSSAMPDITKIGKLFSSEVGGEYKKQVIANELTKPLLYLGLPTGGAQLSKTIKGLSSYAKGGSYSYNDKGEKSIQFPIAQNTQNAVKSTLFGKYSTKEGQKYLEDFKGLNSKQTALYDKSGIDFYELQNYLKASDEAIVTDENKYNRYLDNKGNEYWYDTKNKRLYDKDYNVSNVSIYDLNKDTKKEILTNYIEDMNINLEQKWDLYNFNIFSDTQSENAQYALNNGMTTEEEYIELYKASLNNDVSMPNEEELIELKETGLNLSTYMDYKTKVKKEQEKVKKQNEQKKKTMLPTKDFKEDTFSASDKIELIKKSNYTDKEKDIIYANYINKNDDIYSNLKLISNNDVSKIDTYLNYKVADLMSDKKDDGTKNGKTIPGSAKKKIVDYLNNSEFNSIESLYIYGTKYGFSDLERKTFEEYVDNLKITPDERREIYLTLSSSNIVEMKDGSIKWKK